MTARPMAKRAGSLREKLVDTIRAHGPITVADYMRACLADPDFGYYLRRDPFGAGGDFVTAPEVSQMFGELIGLWSVQAWRGMGSPGRFRLIELGPGRGTLMADALRAARLEPAFLDALKLHLVETSPALKARQAETLRPCGIEPRWHENLAEIPAGAAVLIANEFLDALPVRQFVRRGRAWHERCVAAGEDAALVFVVAEQPADTSALPATLPAEAAEDAIAEARPDAETLAQELGARAARHPLAALIIDYGHLRSAAGDTLQAVRRHAYADPLEQPGEADLTAHVDFEALAHAAETHGLAVRGPITQAAFLLRLGLRQRCDRLLAANPAKAEAIASGADRLVNPAAMGELFKAVALTSRGLPSLPPFGA